MAGELATAPAVTYNVLKDADLPFPTVQLSNGESVRLDSRRLFERALRAGAGGSASRCSRPSSTP